MIGPDLFSFADLWRHYRVCRRNKRTTHSALAFEVDLEANLLMLQSELRERRYRPGRSICFVTDGPKPREVFAADFRDRIVHHLLVAHQERVFEPRFIHDSYACRRGKGTLAASDRAMAFMREASANGRRPAWALKLDVASFFASLHKGTLFAMLQRRIRHPELLWLTEAVLFHDPTRDYHFKSRGRAIPPPGAPGHPVRPEKSLFGSSNQRGLPIGNLTSQFWANVYLNEIDQFVKRELRVRHYVRYVDDMLLLATSPDELIAWRDRIACALHERLHLRLRPEPAIPQRVARGIDFVGWKTWPTRRAVRRSTLERIDTRLRGFAHAHVRPALDGLARRIDLDRPATRAALLPLRSTLASWAGHCTRGAGGDWLGVWRAHAWLDALFDHKPRVARGHRGALDLRWPARELVTGLRFGAAYMALAGRAGDHSLVFWRRGAFIEFYGPQRLAAQRVLGLRPVRVARGPFALGAGFPVRLADRLRRRALATGWRVLDARSLFSRVRGCSGRLRAERIWIGGDRPRSHVGADSGQPSSWLRVASPCGWH